MYKDLLLERQCFNSHTIIPCDLFIKKIC